METNQGLLKTDERNTLVNNIDYFKYIFKKTEKIACAVFYIMRQQTQNVPNEDLSSDLKKSARRLLHVSLKSLRATEQTISTLVADVKFHLIELESELRLAHAGNLISNDTLAVFLNETDSVIRSIRKYLDQDGYDVFDTNRVSAGLVKKAARNDRQIQSASPSNSISTSEPKLPRRDRILSVLKDKGEASIKDIIEVVTDCSEKTIQRDLIGLIKDNLVLREGERRWSKYKPV